MKKATYEKFLFLLYIFILTTLVFILYMHFSENDHFSPFVSTFNHTAQRPFVYRVLPSLIINTISIITGVTPILCTIFIMYISLLGFFVVYSSLVKLFIPNVNLFLSLIFPAVGIIPFLVQSRHVYDFPILFLYTLAFFLLEKKKFGKYFIIFLLASLTKETALFLVLFFAIHFWGMGRKQFFTILMSQLLIFSIIRSILMFVFRTNPGSVAQFHFYDHLNSFSGNPFAATVLYVCIAFIFIVGMTYKGTHSRFIKNALLAVGVPIAILYILFGVPFEIRVFLEIFQIISILFTMKIVTLCKSIKPKPEIMGNG